MKTLKITMDGNRVLSIPDKDAGVAGENLSTALEITVPDDYKSYSKYLNFLPQDSSTITQYDGHGENLTTFTFSLPSAILSKGKLSFNIELKSDSSIYKSRVGILDVRESIDGTGATIEDNPDIIQSLIERMEAAEAVADAASDTADDAEETADGAVAILPVMLDTHNTSDAAHNDIRIAVDTVEAIARGRALAHVFDTYADMTAWLAVPANVETLNTGDNLYIRDTAVKDYWWDGTTAQELEAESPDLVDYYTKAQVDALLPLTLTQAEYDALVAAGTTEAGRVYQTI
jgi:hypothetical protein